MGRRWGKTVLGGTVTGNVLAQHGRVAWIAPTYKNTRPLWRWLLQATAMDVKKKTMAVNRAERSVETFRGGFMGLYSGDNIDSIRGESFHLVVIDEAARIPEDAWNDAIMPTLADYDGYAFLISTPKGKNWFYREWLLGNSGTPDVQSWQAPTSANPIKNIRKAFEKARQRVPEDTFRQEWLAQFIDGGTVFRNARACIGATAQEQAVAGHEYVFGVDWAQAVDYTVITCIDLTLNEVVAIERFNQIDYHTQLSRLKTMNDRFRPAAIISEKNSMGAVLSENLQRMGMPVQMFTTTNATKTEIIQALQLSFENRSLLIPDDPVLIGELESYEQAQLPSGAWKYGAPSGMHDDMVMSLALALYGCDNRPWWIW